MVVAVAPYSSGLAGSTRCLPSASAAFRRHIRRLGSRVIAHPTPVGRAAGGPQTNGKAERFIKTLLDEWAYDQPYTTNEERQAALPVFVEFYNRGRPHTALGGAVILRCCQQRLWGSQLDQLRLGTEMPLDSVNRLAQFSARGLLPPLRPSPLRRPSCSARLAV